MLAKSILWQLWASARFLVSIRGTFNSISRYFPTWSCSIGMSGVVRFTLFAFTSLLEFTLRTAGFATTITTQ